MKEEVKPGQQFEFRGGIVNKDNGTIFSGWEGMLPDLDPGSLPVNHPALILNGRLEMGQVRSRPGLGLLATVPPPWEVTEGLEDPTIFCEKISWLGSHHMQSKPPVLWAITFDSVSKSCHVSTYNPDADPSFVELGIFGDPNAATASGFGLFAGDPYVAASGHLMRINPKRKDVDIILGISATSVCLREFDGKLWIGTAQMWDGLTLYDLTPTLDITSSCVWRDYYMVGVEDGSDGYTYAARDGVWVTDTLPGVLNNPYKNCLVEYQDGIYVASGGTEIWKVIPGVSATVVHTLPDYSTVMAVTAYADCLYYLYTTVDGSESYNYLGVHDPNGNSVQWIDQHKVLSAAGTDHDVYGAVRAMTVYRNRIFVATNQLIATHTLTSDPTSDWYQVWGTNSTTGLLGGD